MDFVCLNQAAGPALRQVLREGSPENFLDHLIHLLKEQLQRGNFVPAFELARLHALTGHHDKALDYLEKAVHEHRGSNLGAKIFLAFQNIRQEPRFHAVLRQLKLEK